MSAPVLFPLCEIESISPSFPSVSVPVNRATLSSLDNQMPFFRLVPLSCTFHSRSSSDFSAFFLTTRLLEKGFEDRLETRSVVLLSCFLLISFPLRPYPFTFRKVHPVDFTHSPRFDVGSPHSFLESFFLSSSPGYSSPPANLFFLYHHDMEIPSIWEFSILESSPSSSGFFAVSLLFRTPSFPKL